MRGRVCVSCTQPRSKKYQHCYIEFIKYVDGVYVYIFILGCEWRGVVDVERGVVGECWRESEGRGE